VADRQLRQGNDLFKQVVFPWPVAPSESGTYPEHPSRGSLPSAAAFLPSYRHSVRRLVVRFRPTSDQHPFQVAYNNQFLGRWDFLFYYCIDASGATASRECPPKNSSPTLLLSIAFVRESPSSRSSTQCVRFPPPTGPQLRYSISLVFFCSLAWTRTLNVPVWTVSLSQPQRCMSTRPGLRSFHP